MDSYFGKRSKRSMGKLYDAQVATAHSAPGFLPTRRGLILFLLVSLLACVLGALVLPAGLGALMGYQQLQEQNAGQAALHYDRGMGYLAENYPELAYTEFQIALKYDPAHEGARQKLDELQAALGGHGTPGASEGNVAPALFEQAKGFVAKKQWSDAILRLEQLRALDAAYRASEVSDLLYQAYSEGGKEAVSLAQIELARERFDAALAIRNLDPEVQRQRDLAVLYLEGQQYAGSKWDVAAQKFAALYEKEPNYADVKKRLVEARVMYGDKAFKESAWCLALREYDAAATLSNDPQIAQKRAQASAQCKERLAATPTPTLTPEQSYTWKVSSGNTACTGAGDLSGFVRDAAGRGVSGVSVSYATDTSTRTTMKTNGNGEYRFALGKDLALYHVSILAADGKTPASAVVDVNYPGGSNVGCHVVVEWQKVQ